MREHSAEFKIKKLTQAFMRQNPEFLLAWGCNTKRFAKPLREFLIENGISEDNVDKHLADRIRQEDSTRKSPDEINRQFFQAVFGEHPNS